MQRLPDDICIEILSLKQGQSAQLIANRSSRAITVPVVSRALTQK
jgi:hypothetical protein